MTTTAPNHRDVQTDRRKDGRVDDRKDAQPIASVDSGVGVCDRAGPITRAV